MAEGSRSTKRRRTSTNSGSSIVIIQPGGLIKPVKGQETFIRHADFWLNDSNLILLAGDTAFRVYRGLLAKKSTVFADTFTAGSADATETFDGCPVVRLTDHPDDLADFLQYLMPCAELRLRDGHPISQFSELHAAIHLAHKYQCPDVHAVQLVYAYPPHIAAIAAVNIARLTETPSMLPFTLYLVCNLGGRMMDGYVRRDGSIEHLADTDLRMCIDARTELTKQTARLLKTVFTLDPSDGSGCTTVGRCMTALSNIHTEMEENALGECDGLLSYKNIIEIWAADHELCEVCTREMLAREVEERRRVWKLLPGVFGLTVEACGFITGNEPSQS